MPPSPPEVTIVVPVFNGARYLRECLDSLVAQTWPRRTILVMDDASTDETPAIVASYGATVVSYRQPANRGQFANVQDGIERAAGTYIAVYHADDVYDSTIVEREVAFLEAHPDAGAVFCLDRFIDAAGREYARLTLPRELQTVETLDHAAVLNAMLTHKNVFLRTPGAMVRAEVYRRLGPFRTEFGSATDLDTWLRAARIAPVGILHEHLFSYRHTATSAGQAYQRLRTEPELHFTILDRHLSDGGSALVTPQARRAFESHRAVDALRISVNAYIKGDVSGARARLRAASLRRLATGHGAPPVRHVALIAAMWVLCRLPHMPPVARTLHSRFHGGLPWQETSA